MKTFIDEDITSLVQDLVDGKEGCTGHSDCMPISDRLFSLVESPDREPELKINYSS